MSLIRVDCPHCKTLNALPKEATGKVARCCQCRNMFPVKAMCTSPVLVAQPVGAKFTETPSVIDTRPRRRASAGRGSRRKLARARLQARKKRQSQFNKCLIGACVVIAIGVLLVITGSRTVTEARETPMNHPAEALNY